jgi:hypothetical protein
VIHDSTMRDTTMREPDHEQGFRIPDQGFRIRDQGFRIRD